MSTQFIPNQVANTSDAVSDRLRAPQFHLPCYEDTKRVFYVGRAEFGAILSAKMEAILRCGNSFEEGFIHSCTQKADIVANGFHQYYTINCEIDWHKMTTKTVSYQFANEPFYVFGLQPRTPLALSEDETRLAYADAENHLNIVDASGAKIMTIRTTTGTVRSLTYACNDELLVSAVNEGLMVYDVAEKSILFNLQKTDSFEQMHTGLVTVVFAFDKYIITGGQDTMLKVWYLGREDDGIYQEAQREEFYQERKAGFELTFLSGIAAHKTEILGIVKSPKILRLATFAEDNATKIWDLNPETHALTQISFMSLHRSDILCADFSNDGRFLATGARDNSVAIWDADRCTILKIFTAQKSDITFIHFSPDDSFIYVGSLEGSCKVMKMPDFTLALEPPEEAVETKLTIPDVSKLVKATDKNQQAFDVVAEFRLHEQDMYFGILAESTPLMITVQNGHLIRFWDMHSPLAPALRAEIFSHTDLISDMSPMDNNNIASCSRDGSFSMLDIEYGEKRTSMRHTGALSAISCRRETQDIFVANEQYEVLGYHLLAGQEPELFCKFQGHRGVVEKMLLTGPVLITAGGDSELMTWEVPEFSASGNVVTVQPARTFKFAPAVVESLYYDEGILLFSAANHSLFIAKLSGTNIRIDVEIRSAHAASILGVVSDGEHIYSCSVDGSVKMWNMRPSKNSAYNESRGVVETTGEDTERCERYRKCSSHSPESVIVFPSEFGIPNCMSISANSLIVGTTSGEIVALNRQLEIIECYDNNGAETVTSVICVGDKIVTGFRKGSVQIWDKSTLCETRQSNVAYAQGK